MASEPGCLGPCYVFAAMDERMEHLERKMNEVVRLLKGKSRTRARGRSPPRREHRRVDEEDRWRQRESQSRLSPPQRHEHRGHHDYRESYSRTREERYSPSSRDGSSWYGGGSQWGSRPPDRVRDRRTRPNQSPRRRNGGRKMELPIFSGEDAPGWLVRIERYFDVNGVGEHERSELILVALEGRALSWYQGWEDQHPYPSWRQFREALLRRFQPEMVKDPYGPLLRLRQNGAVMEYIDAFERVSGPMKEIDREILKGIFINGLKGPLRAEVKSLGLETLEEIKDRALILEERNKEWKEVGVSFGDRKGGFSRGPNSSQVGFGGKVGEGTNRPKPISGGEVDKTLAEGRRLSQAELQDRSRRGLCFKCGDKWGPEHKCKFQHYQLLLVGGDGDTSSEESEDSSVKDDLQLEAKSLQLSLASLKGLTSNKSLKVWGEINGRPASLWWILVLLAISFPKQWLLS